MTIPAWVTQQRDCGSLNVAGQTVQVSLNEAERLLERVAIRMADARETLEQAEHGALLELIDRRGQMRPLDQRERR